MINATLILSGLVVLVVMVLVFISAVQAHYMQRPDRDKDVTFWQFLKDIF